MSKKYIYKNHPEHPDTFVNVNESDNDLYDSIYMDVVKLVEKDNIQCEEYLETMKKLKTKYIIKLRK